ncbi:MAG: hypothetical protein K2X77_27465 [Candidatus Obscuribacterales bacterium]|nr:hypothetical protein [Candidatus Obscuribacterales bacterium]
MFSGSAEFEVREDRMASSAEDPVSLQATVLKDWRRQRKIAQGIEQRRVSLGGRTIGRHNDPWTVQNAREQARKIKLELSEGVVRTEKRREVRKRKAEIVIRQQWEDITLGQVLDDYCHLRDCGTTWAEDKS